jgi:hypothetical protein
MGDDVGSLHEERNEVNDISGYKLYKLYRLIKIRTIHSFFKNRTTHRSSWAFGILNKI